jgi:phage shock protein B
MNTATIATICVFAIPIIAIICGTITALFSQSKKSQSNPEDIKIIQELHRELSRMEKRIEALETILYDEHRRDD